MRGPVYASRLGRAFEPARHLGRRHAGRGLDHDEVEAIGGIQRVGAGAVEIGPHERRGGEAADAAGQRHHLGAGAEDLAALADPPDLELGGLRDVRDDRAGLTEAADVAGHHVPRPQEPRARVEADHLDALGAAVGQAELPEGQEQALGPRHAGRRRHLVKGAVVDRRGEVEVLAALAGDPHVGLGVVDQVRRVLHEPEVEPDLDQDQHHADRDPGRRHRELDAIVQEDLAG
jgi:hypothetical protein